MRTVWAMVFGKMALQYDRRIEQLTSQKFSDAYVENILGNPDEVLASRPDGTSGCTGP